MLGQAQVLVANHLDFDDDSCCQCAQKTRAMRAPTEGAQNRYFSHVID